MLGGCLFAAVPLDVSISVGLEKVGRASTVARECEGTPPVFESLNW